MKKLTFKDQGQDFLEWFVQDGVVIDCRPFLKGVYAGTRIITNMAVGMRPIVRLKHFKQPRQMLYEIEKIEEL